MEGTDSRHIKLSPEASRTLGALMEKSLATPEYYPMTLNALRLACNQKSNRHPVVVYSESDVVAALDELQRLRLVGHQTGSGSRTVKYRHAMAEALGLSAAERAVISCLLVRGPQTPGEIKSRTSRLHDFDHLADVSDVLDGLMDGETPLVKQLDRRPGQKETRFKECLSRESEDSSQSEDSAAYSAAFSSSDSAPESAGSEQPSIDSIHTSRSPKGDIYREVATLRDELNELKASFEQFRKQFE